MSNAVSRQYWYPVTTVAGLESGPVRSRLLGEDLVIFRLRGEVGVLHDLCSHRGTPLSLGRVDDDGLVCAYHGWRYDVRGECVHIPQIAGRQPIPEKARVARIDGYKVQVKFGLVWVCLDEPCLDIPDFPEFDDPSYRAIFAGAYTWMASAARMMENFLDTSHFAWVHPGMLGDPTRPYLDLGEITHFADGFGFRVSSDVPDGTGEGWKKEPATIRYHIPYVFRIVRDRLTEGQASARSVTYTAIQPISAKESRRYTWFARNYAFDRPDEAFLGFLEKLREQDRVVVESQRPEELPLDLSLEMHIRGVDSAAVEFRRLVSRIGLEESAMPEQKDANAP